MENILPIDDIMPMTNWASIVTVQEKLQILTSLSTPTKFQKYIFVDSKGSKVQGTVFNADIQRMGSRIEPCKKYLISNAEVKEVDSNYRKDGNAIQWVISSWTVVEELPNEGDIMPVRFKYTAFKELSKYINMNDHLVDILAVAIHALPENTIQKNNEDLMVQRIIVDASLQPVVLSIWNDFIRTEGRQIVKKLHTYPVVICRRIKVNSYNGVALSTRYDSAIIVEHPCTGG